MEVEIDISKEMLERATKDAKTEHDKFLRDSGQSKNEEFAGMPIFVYSGVCNYPSHYVRVIY